MFSRVLTGAMFATLACWLSCGAEQAYAQGPGGSVSGTWALSNPADTDDWLISVLPGYTAKAVAISNTGNRDVRLVIRTIAGNTAVSSTPCKAGRKNVTVMCPPGHHAFVEWDDARGGGTGGSFTASF